MIRLTRVELRRLLARKVVWLVLVGAAVVAVVTLFGVHQVAREINLARAGQIQWFNEAVRDWEVNGAQQIAECQEWETEERRTTGDDSIDFECDSMTAPTVEDFFGSMPSMVEQYKVLLSYLGYPFLFLALALGSTHIAAEFSHRTMGSWLTFEPRRTLVYLSKALAAALGSLPMVGLSLLIILLGVPVLFRYHGIDDGMSPDDWVSVAWMALRLTGLAMAAGVFGVATAFLLKHSGAVLGIMVGYLVLAEGILGSMLPALQRFLLGRNITAVLENGTEWTTWGACDMYGCEEFVHRLSFTHGTVVLGGLIGVVALLAWLHFRRADVD